jgi:hypothetical protein
LRSPKARSTEAQSPSHARAGDLQRTLAFTGTINGDEIVFTWNKQVQEGGNPGRVNDALFGASARGQFTARRVPDTTDALSAIADRAPRPPVTFDRILHAEREPQNWLTYSGNLNGARYSPLTQITPANVKNLELAWIERPNQRRRLRDRSDRPGRG